jgi:hypothetical protein
VEQLGFGYGDESTMERNVTGAGRFGSSMEPEESRRLSGYHKGLVIVIVIIF